MAFSGKAGAGKNTLARAVQDELARRNQWAVEVGFADALKKELLDHYGMTKEDPGGREKLLEIGHGRREADEDYWVRRLAQRIDSLRPYGVLPLVTDLRYLSELKWARAAGFLVVRVDASGIDRGYVLHLRGEDPSFAYSDHPSEVELDEEDFTVRIWNPHGDGVGRLVSQAYRLTDMLLGQADVAA